MSNAKIPGDLSSRNGPALDEPHKRVPTPQKANSPVDNVYRLINHLPYAGHLMFRIVTQAEFLGRGDRLAEATRPSLVIPQKDRHRVVENQGFNF